MLRWLNPTTRTSELFRETLSHASSSDRATIELPEEFPKAWLHLLMSLTFSIEEENFSKFEEQSLICTQLLEDGMRKVVQSLIRKSLLDYAVFKPWELSSLISFQLLGDIAPQSLDTSDTYFEYLSSLVGPSLPVYNH